jgi:hypothetical protein
MAEIQERPKPPGNRKNQWSGVQVIFSRVLKNAGNRLLTRAALKVADDCKELTEPRP